jgi:hypothetical protein
LAAADEVAAPAPVAPAAVAAVPTDPDPLPFRPHPDAWPHRVDQPDDLVPRHPGVLDVGEDPFHREGVAVADAASLDLDADLARTGFGNVAFDQFERTFRPGDLYRAHLRHL